MKHQYCFKINKNIWTELFLLNKTVLSQKHKALDCFFNKKPLFYRS